MTLPPLRSSFALGTLDLPEERPVKAREERPRPKSGARHATHRSALPPLSVDSRRIPVLEVEVRSTSIDAVVEGNEVDVEEKEARVLAPSSWLPALVTGVAEH